MCMCFLCERVNCAKPRHCTCPPPPPPSPTPTPTHTHLQLSCPLHSRTQMSKLIAYVCVLVTATVTALHAHLVAFNDASRGHTHTQKRIQIHTYERTYEGNSMDRTVGQTPQVT